MTKPRPITITPKTIPALRPQEKSYEYRHYHIWNKHYLVPEWLVSDDLDAAVLSLGYTPNGGKVVWTDQQYKALVAAIGDSCTMSL